jgi:hypothetical protein
LISGSILALLAATDVRAYDVPLFTDIPGANSSAAMPLRILIYNRAGVATTVNVTNIVGGGGPGSDNANSKAAKIRAAINAQAPAYGAGGIMNDVHINGTNRIRIAADPTKEGLDTLNPNIDYRASLQNLGPNSSGLNPGGGQSIVRVGVQGVYVASLMPTSSMTSDGVFVTLANSLETHGVAAHYDSMAKDMFIDSVVPSSKAFVFGNTDTGLSIGAEVAGVPEPGSLLVSSATSLLGLVGWYGRRRWLSR